MADTGIYATTTEIQDKAGAKASAVSKAEAYTNRFVAQAESVINILCRKVFASSSGEFSALPATTRKILSELASNLAGIYVIQYDMSGYTTRGEAEDMVVILRDAFLRSIAILRDKKNQGFLMTGVEN